MPRRRAAIDPSRRFSQPKPFNPLSTHFHREQRGPQRHRREPRQTTAAERGFAAGLQCQNTVPSFSSQLVPFFFSFPPPLRLLPPARRALSSLLFFSFLCRVPRALRVPCLLRAFVAARVGRPFGGSPVGPRRRSGRAVSPGVRALPTFVSLFSLTRRFSLIRVSQKMRQGFASALPKQMPSMTCV